MESAFSKEIPVVLEKLAVDPLTGLSDSEVEVRRKQYGRNEIPPPPPTSFFKLVLKQFEDLLVLILLGAAFISFILALFESEEERFTAFMEPLVILFILIMNATVGVIQESNAEKAIEQLKEMDATAAHVIRDGKVRSIEPAELVPGDIVVLSAGDKVPADLRIISIDTASLAVEESSLTGESREKNKDTSVVENTGSVVAQDKYNILFKSTLVTRGRAKGVVVLTGKETEIGKIHGGILDIDGEDSKTPLQEKLDEFGEALTKVIGVICITVWLINYKHFFDEEHGGALNGAIYYFKIAVALAVAAIPEGLPAVVTSCLALGTAKMAKKNAIVRSLPSVETLGCTTVICSDKTGTLTTNRMSVRAILIADTLEQVHPYSVTGEGWDPTGDVLDKNGSAINSKDLNVCLNKVCEIATLCNDSHLELKNGKFEKVGESTEAALKVLAEKIASSTLNLPKDKLDAAHNHFNDAFKRLYTLEFHRERKSMSVLVQSQKNSGSKTLLVKGAAEVILERSSKIQLASGEIESFPDSLKQQFTDYLENRFASEGLRCLGLAYRNDPVVESEKDYLDLTKYENIESDLVFVGFVGMLDPPRPEVSSAIQTCKDAGIRVIVITGDNKSTATSICKMIGVFSQNEDVSDKAFTGSEFFSKSVEEQESLISHVNLFARVEPLHKQKIVELLQKERNVVAMTGDGVNDAPALKKADIGIAMGTGTAVAKEASDMVLQDDNFSTIVMAVSEGRAIYANTKGFIRYLISSNIGEVVCIFLTAAIGMPEALIPVQLLWVNLVTDGLPATALGFNPPDKDIMTKPPRGRGDSIISGWLFFRYLAIGCYVGIATVLGFIWWYLFSSMGPSISYEQLVNFRSCSATNPLFSGVNCAIFHDARPSTVSLSILVTIEMLNTFNALSENQSLFTVYPWCNPWVILAVALSFSLHFLILYVPFFAPIFSVAPISLNEWMAVLALSAPIILIDEILKFITRIMSSTRAENADDKKLN